MSQLKIDFRTEDSIKESIEVIADDFASRVALQANDALYRIVDFEFYLRSDNFPDPYPYSDEYGNSPQLKNGTLFKHKSGMDITCGDGMNHGGILIRSVINIRTAEQIQGPINCLDNLFSQLQPLTSSGQNIIRLIGENFKPKPIILRSPRIGLPKAKDPGSKYLNAPLRYVVCLPRSDGFKQTIEDKEATVRYALSSGQIGADRVYSILGYNPSWL